MTRTLTPGQPIPAEDVAIFLDCDGVLADFDTYAEAYFGMNPREYERQMGSERFWAELEAKGDFYRNLPLMPDARTLVDGVRHLSPTILTGCPRGNWAESQKVAWAEEHFPGIPIITCRSSDKRAHAKPGDVLIDDWPQHRHRWVEMGGVFISHFDAATSLATLWAHYPSLRLSRPEAADHIGDTTEKVVSVGAQHGRPITEAEGAEFEACLASATDGGKNWDAIRSHPCYDEHQPGCGCPEPVAAPPAPASPAGEWEPSTDPDINLRTSINLVRLIKADDWRSEVASRLLEKLQALHTTNDALQADNARLREVVADAEETARRYANCYPVHSDGRNTFLMLADHIARQALATEGAE